MTNGSVTNSVRRAHRNAITLIGFLAIPKSTRNVHVCLSKYLTHILNYSGTAVPERPGFPQIPARAVPHFAARYSRPSPSKHDDVRSLALRRRPLPPSRL